MYDIFDLNFNTTTGNETEQVETNISLKQFPNPDFFSDGNANPKNILIKKPIRMEQSSETKEKEDKLTITFLSDRVKVPLVIICSQID